MNGAGTAAHVAAIQNAIKASGAIIKIEVNEFVSLLSKMDPGLVIESQGGLFSASFKYLTSYKGFVFYTKSGDRLSISGKHEMIRAKRIWVPE
ncbi:hypothetical protein QQ008_05595 [Fulvivirgaceae bacterium BMA10]|uniref:Uncharacterized protein n=1 Tax=Splendidivirga corallicola TaxID=3051826 RepID=A0ABT8KMR1_9BACT|nr:hypothetical protein [Fulvivirgaceae bacterium BMA10]